MISGNTRPWQIIRHGVLALCVLTALSAATHTVLSKNILWDLHAYCGSIRAVEAGLDPYHIENVKPFSGNELIIAYPVATLLSIAPACVAPRVVFPVLSALLVLWVWAAIRSEWPHDPLLLAAVLTSGFAALHWNLITGNLSLLELAAFTAAIVALRRGAYAAAGVWMGIIAAAKLTPVILAVLLAAYLLRDSGRRPLARYVVGAVVGFAFLHGISILISPHYEYSMLLVLLGRLPPPGQFTPMHEWTGNWANPAWPLVVKDFLKALSFSGKFMIPLYLLQAAGSAVILWRLWQREKDGWVLLSYGLLLTCLLLPRLKPYYFVYPLIPLYYLLAQRTARFQALVLTVALLLPVIAYRNPLDQYVDSPALKVALNASQVLFLLLTVVLLLWSDRKLWWGPAPTAQDGAPR